MKHNLLTSVELLSKTTGERLASSVAIQGLVSLAFCVIEGARDQRIGGGGGCKARVGGGGGGGEATVGGESSASWARTA